LIDVYPIHSMLNWRIRHVSLREFMMTEARVIELERKLDTVMRGLNLLLFEEGEVFPEEEIKELKTRLDDYLKGRRSEFVTLDET